MHAHLLPPSLCRPGIRIGVVHLLMGGLLLVANAPCQGAQAPADVPVLYAGSPFGIGGDYHTGQDLTRWMPRMAAIGIHEMRCCYVRQMDYLDSLHIAYGGLLYGRPPGDKIDAPGTLPVKDIPAWSAFVTSRVKKAAGRVKYWEVWNEPPNGTGPHQTPADYARIMISTYDAAHAVDPTCMIGLATKSVDVNYLELAIKGGAKDHFDYITVHPYEVLGGIANDIGTEAIYMNIVPVIRKMLAAQDPARADVPIIFTEIGCDAGRSPARQADALVKAYTMGIAEGVACIHWFEGMDGDSGPMGLLKGDGTPRPAYKAMEQMIEHLGQHPRYLGWVLLNGTDYAFVFQGPHGPVLITWAYKGVQDRITFGGKVSITDPSTGVATRTDAWDLTTAPIIVEDVPGDLAVRAHSGTTQPFPWGGDYTKVKSVSITMGKTIVEKGLHNQSGATVAADVLAYGGSARAGSIPGGTVFMVDPNFLSYTDTPIEISIVVRRNAANDNAGFKLRYESTNGFKDCGWYTVPDNKSWHTVKWTIKDAEFVNYWDYNFSLDSDGNKFNKYDIQSVTVRKLN